MTIVAPAYLSQFGALTLQLARGAFQWPAAARPSVVPTINGSFDAAGLGRAGTQLPYQLSYTAAVVNATDTAAVLTTIDALRAQTDSYNELWLTMANGTTRWAMARLVNVSPTMGATQRTVIMFNALFEVATVWHGTVYGAWAVDTGPEAAPVIGFASGLYAKMTSAMTLTATPASVNLANAGNAPIYDLGLIIEAGSTAITYLKLTTPHGVGLEYTSTIAAGARLIIDGGAQTITNNGADAFNGLQRLSTHTIPGWFYLPAAAEVLTVTFTGGVGDSLILPVYADRWA
jgi:hypothetical protein